ncbi:ribosomal RNA small subunit methyltransferase E [Bacteroidia bacterium]|nr:ribosomal RNA small subunit methyltransferase E [Bacteroidia bacterium]
MTIFYAPDIEKSPFLPEEESQHAVKVLRMKSGERICVIDGAGGLYEAEIALPHAKYCEVKILQKTAEYGKRNHYLHIGIAPTKNIERLEWFVEKAVEIGIDEITPIVCQHSERKVLKTGRLQKIILAAAKQSLKAYLPKLNDIVTFEKLINTPFLGNKYIAHCYEEERKLLQNIYPKGQSALILIGAEGDFSREEVQAALKNGFLPVSLGNSRLRTETAGVVACHTVNLINE